MKKTVLALFLTSSLTYGADFSVEFTPADGSISDSKVVSIASSKISDFTSAVLAIIDSITNSKRLQNAFPVGTILTSILTPAQFQAQNGNCWVRMTGQSITGSDLHILAGYSTLPNAAGRFLRNIGGNAPALGQVQEDAFQGHLHSGIPNTYMSTPGVINSVHPELWQSGDKNSGGPVSDGTNGTPRIANETRPQNLGVNMFIKINNSCN